MCWGGGGVVALSLGLLFLSRLALFGDGSLEVVALVRRGDDLGGIVPNPLISIDEAKVVGTLDPVLLGRAHTPGPGRLEGSVRELHLGGDGLTGLEVEALHIGDGLVDPADGAGVADGALGSFLGVEVLAEDAADAHLTDSELLCTLGVTHAHLSVGGCEDLDEVLSDVALAVGEGGRVGIAVKTKDDTPFVVGLSHLSSTSALVVALVVRRRNLAPLWRPSCHGCQRIRRLGDGSRGHHGIGIGITQVERGHLHLN